MVKRWVYDFDTVSDFDRARKELYQMFDIGLPISNIRSVPRGTFPQVNIVESKESVSIYTFVPGVDPGKVDVVLDNNTLTITGQRKTAGPESGQAPSQHFHRRERHSGAFTRIISLPEGLDPDKIEAHYKDGILKITISKTEEKKPRQIAVKVA